MALGYPGFQAGHEGPKFVDGLRSVAGLSAEDGAPDGGRAELEHRFEVGVFRVADAQRVGRYRETSGDPKPSGHIVDLTSAGFDHGNIGGVVAE